MSGRILGRWITVPAPTRSRRNVPRWSTGSVGAPGEAPWPRIIVAAAAPAVPDALVVQLADDGRLVIPVGGRREQDLILVERHGVDVISSNHGPCVFVPLRGAAGWA